MRYCNQCRHITAGEPLFCSSCGSTYNVKLCPSRHINPRSAEVCSECGSRDLSTPAPPTSFWVSPGLYVLSLLPGILLLLVSVLFLVGFIQMLISHSELMRPFFGLGLILALLWYAYIQLPPFLKGLFKTIWHRSKKSKHTH